MVHPKKIALYGGSFSPPHFGHVLAARAYLDAAQADRIIIMPAKRPPHKDLDGMADDRDRVQMCRLAFEQDSVLFGRCEVSEWELCRDDVSYTINTVEHFLSEGYEDISLLVGTDMLLSFESWFRYKDLFRSVNVYYIDRCSEKREDCIECALRFTKEYGASIIPLDVPAFEVSSSEIREKIMHGQSTQGLLPEKVMEYILQNGLYKTV